MKQPSRRFPILMTALLAGSLLLGLTLAPAIAQQSGLTNGVVTVRSDGAVYLILNGQRRWVATVAISDDELNAYPEAEPIYTALAPFGSAPVASAPSSTGTSNTSTNSSSGSTNSAGTTTRASSTPTTSSGSSSKPSTSSNSSTKPTDADSSEENTIDPVTGQFDPTRAEVAVNAAQGTTNPVNGACPDSHMVKGVLSSKEYYDVDHPSYASITPDICFTAGGDARASGYTKTTKPPSTTTTSTGR